MEKKSKKGFGSCDSWCLESSFVFHAVRCWDVCCRVPYPPGRRSAFWCFIVSLSFNFLSSSLSKYRTFCGSIYIFVFVERFTESFGAISNTSVLAVRKLDLGRSSNVGGISGQLTSFRGNYMPFRGKFATTVS